MPNTKDFIADFGTFTFEERPFCDADALALCEIFYMPFEDVVSPLPNSTPMDFAQCCDKLFEQRGSEHKPLGLLLTNVPSKRMMEMANCKRYKGLKIISVKNIIVKEPATQYCCGTFLLPDGTIFMQFRGTDDTVVGWKEDIDVFTLKNVPSYDLALEDIEAIANLYSGNIILCGHSKGGNVALLTACKCKEETRNRISLIYNFDGPGYGDYSIFATKEYTDLLPRYKHFVPSSSFMGMLLFHDYDYKAVKSNKHIGLLQHDIGTWQIENGEIVIVDDTDCISKIIDDWLNSLLKSVPDNAKKDIDDIITGVCFGLGYDTLKEVSQNAVTAVNGAKTVYKVLDENSKATLKNCFKGGGQLLKKSARLIYHTTYRTSDMMAHIVNNLT